MTELKKTVREGEVAAKEAWRKRDGEDLSDKLANAGDEVRKDIANAGDDLSDAAGDAKDRLDREAGTATR
jgi:hypothetical protein